MYLLDTDYIPDQNTFRGRPQKPYLLLQDFLRQNRNIMQVCFTRYEYKDAASCRSTLAKAIRYYHLEKQIAVRVSGTKVYLMKLPPEEARP